MKRRGLTRGALFAKSAAAFTAGGLAAPSVLRAAPVILQAKSGSANIQSTNSIALRTIEAFKAIDKESDGAIKIELFTDDSLGSVDSELVQLRTGAIQFNITTGTVLSTLKPIFGLEGVGFMFKSYRELYAAYDGQLGKRVRAELTDVGLIPIGRVYAGGPLHLSTWAKPIRDPDSLQGMKIRTSNARSVRDLISALGANPASVSPNEVYTACQTHLIDGTSNIMEGFEGQHLYEVQKYLALTYHVWANYFCLANADVWRGIPDKYKDIISRNVDKAAQLQRRDNESLQSALATRLGQQGMTVNTTDAAQFRARLGAYYASQKAIYGNDVWAMVESVVGKLST